MTFRADDINLLLPSFAAYVRLVLEEMKRRGYDPCPFDTLRTQAEAAKFFARGVGSLNSMHCYGVACDVICNKHGWECSAHGCEFFSGLGDVVEALGLVWGGRFKSRHDLPHFQGCGAGAAEQARVRAIKDPVTRDAYIAARLCRPR
jgi:hypothetical protein